MVLPLGLLVHLRVLVTMLKLRVGRYSSCMVAERSLSGEFDSVEAASLVPDHPNVWSDGSLVLDQVSGVSHSGAGFLLSRLRIAGLVVGGVMLMEFDLRVRFRLAGASAPFLGCSLFRELRMWGVILALQSSGAVHLGVDNLRVVRHVGRSLDGKHGSVPIELVKDGDLLLAS